MAQRKLRKQIGIAAMVSGAVAAPAVIAEPALAQHPSDTCPAHTLCEWGVDNFNGNGPVKWWGRDDNSYAIGPYPDGDHFDNFKQYRLNDKTQSFWNNASRWVKICPNAGCREGSGAGPFIGRNGPGYCFAPGQASAIAPGNFSAHYFFGGHPGNCLDESWTRPLPQGCSL
jgi:peptidase inhibitor family I36